MLRIDPKVQNGETGVFFLLVYFEEILVPLALVFIPEGLVAECPHHGRKSSRLWGSRSGGLVEPAPCVLQKGVFLILTFPLAFETTVCAFLCIANVMFLGGRTDGVELAARCFIRLMSVAFFSKSRCACISLVVVFTYRALLHVSLSTFCAWKDVLRWMEWLSGDE